MKTHAHRLAVRVTASASFTVFRDLHEDEIGSAARGFSKTL
jgi:hypothetical protein